jgi:predicted O-linked N-acetylglucosamine transferase (SPINDLY family)
LIAHSPQEYEALAMDLADNPGKLADLRKRLAHNRLVMPLFNTRVFARHIEAAYEAMYQRCQSGLRPEHIDVAAIET